jgi:anti-sigma factor (TIGR02949 family)
MTALSRYTCEEAFRHLDDFLDGELAPEVMERVHAHLQVCENCAREFKFEGSVVENLRGRLRDVPVPAELADRIRGVLDRVRAADDTT